jgi:hypothetical protein
MRRAGGLPRDRLARARVAAVFGRVSRPRGGGSNSGEQSGALGDGGAIDCQVPSHPGHAQTSGWHRRAGRIPEHLGVRACVEAVEKMPAVGGACVARAQALPGALPARVVLEAEVVRRVHDLRGTGRQSEHAKQHGSYDSRHGGAPLHSPCPRRLAHRRRKGRAPCARVHVALEAHLPSWIAGPGGRHREILENALKDRPRSRALFRAGGRAHASEVRR